jgi:hypothetical protein
MELGLLLPLRHADKFDANYVVNVVRTPVHVKGNDELRGVNTAKCQKDLRFADLELKMYFVPHTCVGGRLISMASMVPSP